MLMKEADLKKNYFELFELPLQFEVEERELADRYKNLQRRLHPDTVATADDRQKRFAVQTAAYVNEAYRILSNPVDRAGYLLQQAGYKPDAADRQLTPEFLMRQIQLREELEAIPGTENPRECLLELRERIDREIDALYGSFPERMRRGDYTAAGDIVRKLQFFQRLQDEMDELQFELEEELD
ncbi:MAG TPA: Fe-S protein assembly co-chaperone HscB [Gammaproteobacteria bacterium]|nr:Fe-S protein assembly co-chaperone HscB [Gammaproteobacteria bacterium]